MHNRPRHWVLYLDLVLQLDQQTLLKPQLHDHSILPIFVRKKVAFRTSRELLHRKPNALFAFSTNNSIQFRTTSEAEASISFEFVVNFSSVWFGRGREIHDHFWQIRATTVINPCNKLWRIHEKTLTNLILTLNFKVLVTMIGFGSDKKISLKDHHVLGQCLYCDVNILFDRHLIS